MERNTIVSSYLLKQLEESKHPLTASQILNQFNALGLRPNKTTIYRILQKLITKKVVTEIAVKNKATYYELFRKDHHHHHHFICNECDIIFCLDSCHVESQKINLTELLPNKQFKIQFHDFNLYGICDQCIQ